MGRTKYRPTYELNEAKRFARAGKLKLSGRASRFLREHYGTVSDTAVGILEIIEPRHFDKSVELDNRPGTWADVYRGAIYDEVEWYVKFFIENESPTVEVWSMNWDGAVH